MAVDERGLAPSARVNPGLPYFGSSIKRQTETIMMNVAAICEAAGTSLENVVKRHAFFADLRDFAPSWEVWQAGFSGVLPAETTVGLGGPLVVPGCTLMMDLIAYAPHH
jgi:enamine deaminase RidA (YjgF/YER057c/UK114 family)